MEKKISELTWQEKVALRDELLKKCNAHYSAVGDNDPTPEQRKEVVDWNQQIEELEHGIDESREYHELKARLNQAYEQRQIEMAGGGVLHPSGISAFGARAQRKTLGQLFTESKEFKDWIKDVSGGKDELSDSAKIGMSPSVPYQRKDLIVLGDVSGALNSQVSAGALTQPDYQPLVRLPFAPLVLRDLISVGTTQSPIVTYPREKSRNIAAIVVPEAATSAINQTSLSPGGQKPESALTIEKVVAPVKTIAHWIPATKQALSDAGQLRMLIDSFLINGLEQVLEDQLLNGDGTSDNLLGLENTPGVSFQNFDTDVLTTTRKARTRVEVDGLAVPTAYVMNPRDWEAIELLKDGIGRYYYGGPSILGNPRLWGLPVALSFKMRKGTSYCADWKTVALWDREQGNVRVAEQHADFFTRNMVVLLAEERVANGVFRPVAVCQTDMFAGPNS